jgi:hypothetical protein
MKRVKSKVLMLGDLNDFFRHYALLPLFILLDTT